MEISLRSQLAAGCAVAAAAAIAVTPVVQPDIIPSLKRTSANVELAANWANPLAVLGDTLNLVGIYSVGTEGNLVTGLISAGQPFEFDPIVTYEGFITQIINGSAIIGEGEETLATVPGLPLLAAVATNVSGYLSNTFQALGAVSGGVGGLAFGIPLTAFEVINGLISGTPVDVAEAIQTNVVAPISAAFDAVVASASNLVDSVVKNVTAVLTALPKIVVAALSQTADGFSLLASQLVDTVSTAFGEISTPQVAWNTLINGLIGPEGVLGNAIQLSFGEGVGSGPEFVPSLRQVLTTSTVNGALGITNPPAPLAAVRPSVAGLAPKSAASVSAPANLGASAATVEATSAPANSGVAAGGDGRASVATVEATSAPVDSGAATGDDGRASAPRASKHRVSRQPSSR